MRTPGSKSPGSYSGSRTLARDVVSFQGETYLAQHPEFIRYNNGGQEKGPRPGSRSRLYE